MAPSIEVNAYEGTRVTLLGDRAFGYIELYHLLKRIGWEYVLRFRGNILVEDENGVQNAADEWVFPNGRPRILKSPKVTAKRASIPAIVVVKAKKMKEAWCLATSLSAANAAEVVAKYAKRFSIEETFRDTKDLNFENGSFGDPYQRRRSSRPLALSRRSGPYVVDARGGCK